MKIPLTFNNKAMNNSVKKKKTMKRFSIHLIKENMKMANKPVTRYSTSNVIREMKIKKTISYHYTPVRIAKT